MGVAEMVADVAALAEQIGGRRAGSPEAAAAATYVARALDGMGWTVLTAPVGSDHNVWTCGPGTPERVFLAHTDTVHADVPGAVDNAAAVAVLLQAARETAGSPLPGVCFAFPAAEERGLVGSRRLPLRPRLAVALDLVGHGTLAVTGIGPAWGDGGLAWLVDVPVTQPYAYRVVSRLLPAWERSDHAAFARPGVLTMQLLGRGPSGVYWPYHTPLDTIDRVEPAALEDALAAVRVLATAPLPAEGPPSPAFSAWGFAVPGWSTWTGVGAGIAAGIAAGRPAGWRALGRAAGRALFAAIAGLAAWELALVGRPGDAALAGPAALSLVGAWASVALGGSGTRAELDVARILTLALAAPLAWLDPLLGLPWAVGAAAFAASARAWAFGALALVPAGYLLLPDTTRELAFHHVFPSSGPVRAVVLGLLLWPLGGWLAALPVGRRPARVLAGFALAAGLAVAWLTEPWSPDLPERPERIAR